MKRANAKNGLLTCWICGGGDIRIAMSDESGKYPYHVCCGDCGERTLDCPTEEAAKKAWGKAYALSLD